MLSEIRGSTLLRHPATGAALFAIDARRAIRITAALGPIHVDCSGVVFIGLRQDSSTRCDAESLSLLEAYRLLFSISAFCIIFHTCQIDVKGSSLDGESRGHLLKLCAMSIFHMYGNENHTTIGYAGVDA